jgi:hypothetical protein
MHIYMSVLYISHLYFSLIITYWMYLTVPATPSGPMLCGPVTPRTGGERREDGEGGRNAKARGPDRMATDITPRAPLRMSFLRCDKKKILTVGVMQGTDWWKCRAWLLLLCAWSVDVICALNGRGPAAASRAAFVHALARAPIWCPRGPLRLRGVRDGAAGPPGRAPPATSAIITPLNFQCIASCRAPGAALPAAGGAAFGRVQGRRAPGTLSQLVSWGWGSRDAQPGGSVCVGGCGGSGRRITTMLRVSRRDRESLASDKKVLNLRSTLYSDFT